jgi:hypothetical protein
MPRTKGAKDTTREFRISASMFLAKIIQDSSGLTKAELGKIFGRGGETYSKSANADEKEAKQWDRYLEGRTALSFEGLNQFFCLAEAKALIPKDENGALSGKNRQYAYLKAYAEFFRTQQQLMRAISHFTASVKDLPTLDRLADGAAPHRKPLYRTREALDTQKIWHCEASLHGLEIALIMEKIALDIDSLQLNPAYPVSLIAGEGQALLKQQHEQVLDALHKKKL